MDSIAEVVDQDTIPYAALSAGNLLDEIALAAHDLRNPLACVVSTLELLDAKAAQGKSREVNAIVRRGLRAVERMDAMLQRLMENANHRNGAIHASQSSVSLRHVVEAAVELNVLSAQRKSISIKLAGSDVLAQVNEGLLVEAIDNLVSNAVKYSHPGTQITCEIGRDLRSVFVRVTDQGQGLTPGDLARMGRPYQRLSARPTGGESSTGLGLWAVRRIVGALGGDLHAESGGPDQGATFTIRLPGTTAPHSSGNGAPGDGDRS